MGLNRNFLFVVGLLACFWIQRAHSLCDPSFSPYIGCVCDDNNPSPDRDSGGGVSFYYFSCLEVTIPLLPKPKALRVQTFLNVMNPLAIITISVQACVFSRYCDTYIVLANRVTGVYPATFYGTVWEDSGSQQPTGSIFSRTETASVLRPDSSTLWDLYETDQQSWTLMIISDIPDSFILSDWKVEFVCRALINC